MIRQKDLSAGRNPTNSVGMQSQMAVKTFFFWSYLILGKNSSVFGYGITFEKTFESPILAEKSVLILVKTFFFFFFWRPPDFGRKKRLNFRGFREIPCETDSRAMKIRVKVVCTFLTLSKKLPPPFPNPGYAPGWKYCDIPPFEHTTKQKEAKYS